MPFRRSSVGSSNSLLRKRSKVRVLPAEPDLIRSCYVMKCKNCNATWNITDERRHLESATETCCEDMCPVVKLRKIS